MTQNDSALFRFRGPWGVPVVVEQSLMFLLILIFMVNVGAGSQGLMDAVLIAAILVLSILLHELGHAWGALIQRVPVHAVVLHGGGGYCSHGAADARASELIVAMGPLVNLGLWALLSLGAEALWASIPQHGAYAAYAGRIELAGWLWFAANLNLMLVVLNLMPVQPLDGGKLLHLMLLRVTSAPRAVRVAGAVGLLFCIAWIPAMIVMFVSFGLVLLFLPNVRLHWQMLRSVHRLGPLTRR